MGRLNGFTVSIPKIYFLYVCCRYPGPDLEARAGYPLIYPAVGKGGSSFIAWAVILIGRGLFSKLSIYENILPDLSYHPRCRRIRERYLIPGLYITILCTVCLSPLFYPFSPVGGQYPGILYRAG